MRLVVVGGDAAGMSAAAHVVRAVPGAEVLVVEQGTRTSYSACGIPYLVAGYVDDEDRLVARTPEEHRRNGIDVRMQTRATAVDLDARAVHLHDLVTGTPDVVAFDALLLATGAHPRAPDAVPGLREVGMTVQTLDEGVRLRDRLLQRRGIERVAVLGGGYIGLEVAEALVERGLQATLLDRNRQVLGALDPDMAVHVQRALEGLGVDVRLGVQVERVEVDAGCCVAVVTSDGVVEAQVVVVALGSRPNVRLAEEAGIRLGPTGAVAVDDRMRTSAPGVWAAGDCAESHHLLLDRPVNIQLGTHANKHGKVAAVDIAAVLRGEEGGDARFPGVVGTAVTRVCAWEVGRTGLSEREAQAAGIDHAVASFTGTARSGYMPDPGTVHVKVLAERPTGRVLGAQLVGTGNVGKRIDVAATWCQLGVTVQQAQLLDLAYAPPFGGTWDLLQVAARKLAKELDVSPQL